MIRRFLPDDKWDSIIYTAIAHHSDYELPEISDPQTLLHAKLIRDEDKLDNCRVKLVDSTNTFINVSEGELGTQNIPKRYTKQCLKINVSFPQTASPRWITGYLISSISLTLTSKKALIL